MKSRRAPNPPKRATTDAKASGGETAKTVPSDNSAPTVPPLCSPMSIKNSYAPIVIEQTSTGERQYDIFSRLLKDRIIMLGTAIDDQVADIVVAQLLFLQSEDSKKDIDLYINSPGGVVTAGLAIYDTMQMLSCDVRTYCVGQAASMGAVLLCAGAPGKRYALPHSRIMIHQPSGGCEGTAADINIQAQEIMRTKATLYDIIAHHTGKSAEQIAKDSERDFFMSAQEAKDYNVVDEVITPATRSK